MIVRQSLYAHRKMPPMFIRRRQAAGQSFHACGVVPEHARDTRFKNPHPEIVTSDVTLKSSRQVSQHLLCVHCERRLEQGGETWVIPRCWQDPTSFPLREALVAANVVVESGPGFETFAAVKVPDFEPDKLAYFAASLFWRGAVSDWNIHQQRLRQLKLGPYKDELRFES